MPTTGSARIVLLDTSAAVAFVVADHDRHDATFDALADLDLGLAGHAAFEAFSVLTRLPPPSRLTAAAAGHLLRANFPHGRFLSARRAAALFGSLPGLRVAGGSVYDALIGAVAVEHGLPLVSCDRRALPTYRELRVEVRMIH